MWLHDIDEGCPSRSYAVDNMLSTLSILVVQGISTCPLPS